jgi:protein subunit release factor B
VSKWPTDRESLERVCEIQPTRGSGPGGQHRNKVETGVRVSHPSGIVVVATRHRSRVVNMDDAFERIAARLTEAQTVQKPRTATRPTRSSKRRRMDAKRREGDKKRDRRKVDD